LRILVVEDEEELREAIVRRLRAQGHGVDGAGNLALADELVSVNDYGVVVLDRRLPDGDGVSLLRGWRERELRTPVLVLTARDEIGDRVAGLEAGADDYLVKPFAMAELLARVAAVGRRGPIAQLSAITVADVEIDTARREVRRGGVLLPLRPKEFALIQLLASRLGQAVSRQEIVGQCWDEEHDPLSNVEEVLVASLRRKLGKPSLIRTVRGVGYLLEEPAAGQSGAGEGEGRV